MSDFKFWNWDKKPKTMLRFVKSGDIFCFRLDDKKYYFGRVVSKIITGHVAEIFDFISIASKIKEDNIKKTNRVISLVVLDTYSLFDKKIEDDSDWRIIGHQNGYSPMNVENVFLLMVLEAHVRKWTFSIMKYLLLNLRLKKYRS